MEFEKIHSGKRYHYRDPGRGIDEVVRIESIETGVNLRGETWRRIDAKLADGTVVSVSPRRLTEPDRPTLTALDGQDPGIPTRLPEVIAAAKNLDDAWWTDAGRPADFPVKASEFSHFAGPERTLTFANETEAMFARHLDSQGIAWQHEPTLFQLERPEGSSSRTPAAFLPDIYLPEKDLYVELTTTANCSLGRKNIKLRAMHRQHPTERVLMVSRASFAALLAADDVEPLMDRMYEHQQARLGLSGPAMSSSLS